MYPQIEIDLKKLQSNAKTIAKMCEDNHINSRFLVTKVLAGDLTVISSLLNTGFSHFADSRIENLKKFQHLKIPKVLLRLPMISQVDEVIKYSDLSLNSEIKTIQELNKEALKQDKVHQIILMFDIGDLREGIYFQNEYLSQIETILKLTNIHLVGIGTNLTCYGGIIPSKEILQRLVVIKEKIETRFKIQLSIISGGNSSTFHLFNTDEIPKEINNLRIGEIIFLGRETAFGKFLPNLYDDVFIIKAEIVELKTKPSYPLGEMGMNSFGEKPNIIDKGLMKRGILAIGKQDIQIHNLFPIDKRIEIVGGSSDHLIVDLTHSDYHLGDIISFKINYPGLLQAMTSPYIEKKYVKNG